MQLLLPLLTSALPLSLAYHTKLQTTLHTDAANSAWAALDAAEAEERSFWQQQLEGLERNLLQLSSASGSSATALLQAGNASDVMAKLDLNLNPKSTADLVPALAMLKGLYESGKERIAELNQREQKSKARFAEKEKQHALRTAAIDDPSKKVSAGFRANETADEARIFAYWQRCREREHRMFHTSLKIQHGTMEREKKMIEMYEKAIAGTDNKAEMRRETNEMAGSMPDVAMLQEAWKKEAPFFREALAEVRAEMKEEEGGPKRGGAGER